MVTRKSPPEIARDVIERFESLSTELEVWKTNWQDIATYIQPRKASITITTSVPDGSRAAQLFTSTAIRSNQILANGMVSMMTPVESPWFAFDAPARFQKFDSVKAWYAQATEGIRAKMASSNFYTEVHEMFLDRGGFGTAAMHVEQGKKALFNFTNLSIGSYAIAEDDEGYVDSVIRVMEMTIRQAAQKFGADNLSVKTREKLKSDNPKSKDEKITVLHAIYPRADGEYEAGKLGRENMPIASCYVEKGEKHLIEEGGYTEMPTFVTRYLKWGDGFTYGWCPSWFALPTARQLNFLEKMMDTLAEKAAFPPSIAPSSMEGVTTLDVRANGVTYVEADEANILREWQTQGRYDVGKDRVTMKEEEIKAAYHVDLFQMFSSYDGPQMTAYEASLKQNEKLIQFSPTNTRLTTEFFNPLLQRVWGIAIRAGILPPPPPEIIEQGLDGVSYIPEPNITYTSRIALAIKSLETEGFQRTMALITPYIEVRPDILDNINFDVAIPDTARNVGMPARFLTSDEDRDAIRQARAQQRQQQMQLEQANLAAKTLKDVGSANPAGMQEAA